MTEPRPSVDPVPFRHSLAIQFRVVGALMMREIITRYGRHNVGFLWLFLEPMIFTLGVAMLWSFMKTLHGSQLPIIPFAITGYSSVLLWRNAASRCSKALEPNLSLLYHRNVTVIDIFIARLVLEIAGATASLIVLLSLFIFLGLASLPADPLTMAIAWSLLCVFSAGLGLIVGALSERSTIFERIWHTATYLFFPLSGAVFMVDWLPTRVQGFFLWIPMVNAVEMLRGGYFGPVVRTHYSVGYLVMVNLIMLWVGLLLVHRNKDLVSAE